MVTACLVLWLVASYSCMFMCIHAPSIYATSWKTSWHDDLLITGLNCKCCGWLNPNRLVSLCLCSGATCLSTAWIPRSGFFWLFWSWPRKKLIMWSVLFQVLAYSCVYSYYNQDTEKLDIMEQQTENLELHTNALQILLGEKCYWASVCFMMVATVPGWCKESYGCLGRRVASIY